MKRKSARNFRYFLVLFMFAGLVAGIGVQVKKTDKLTQTTDKLAQTIDLVKEETASDILDLRKTVIDILAAESAPGKSLDILTAKQAAAALQALEFGNDARSKGQ